MQPYTCFVGHVFNEEQIDDFRKAIARGFPQALRKVDVRYADEEVKGGSLFDKVRAEIERALFCFFEISNSAKPNVFLELGYALGRQKVCILLLKKGAEPPSDLAGFDRIEYRSMADLTKQLKSFLPKVMGIALDGLCRTGRMAQIAIPLVALLFKTRVGTKVDTVKLLEKFYGASPNPEEGEHLNKLFLRLGWIEKRENHYTDFSVVLFRPHFMLLSEGYPMKVHKNQ